VRVRGLTATLAAKASRHEVVIRSIAWAVLVCQSVAAFFILPRVRGDAPDYLRLADDLARGSFGTAAWPEAMRPPGYPLFLCVLHNLMGLPVDFIAVLQLLMYIGSIWAVSRFLSGRARTIFVCFAAVYPFAAFYASAIMAEAIATLLLTIIALLVARLSWARVLLAGALSGLLTMFRPDFALLPLALALGFGWRQPMRAVAMIIAAAAVMTPYAMWNAANFGKLSPVPVAGALGTSLYLSTWQDKVSLESLNALYAGRATPEAQKAGLIAEVTRINRSIGAPPLTAPWNPADYSPLSRERAAVAAFGDAAIARIKADPAFYVRHVVLNVWRLWNSSSYPALAPLLALISGMVALLGFCGAALNLWRPHGPLTQTQVLAFLYLPAVHIGLHTEARYTAAARPLLLMYAAWFVVYLMQRVFRQGSPEYGGGEASRGMPDKAPASLVPNP